MIYHGKYTNLDFSKQIQIYKYAIIKRLPSLKGKLWIPGDKRTGTPPGKDAFVDGGEDIDGGCDGDGDGDGDRRRMTWQEGVNKDRRLWGMDNVDPGDRAS